MNHKSYATPFKINGRPGRIRTWTRQRSKASRPTVELRVYTNLLKNIVIIAATIWTILNTIAHDASFLPMIVLNGNIKRSWVIAFSHLVEQHALTIHLSHGFFKNKEANISRSPWQNISKVVSMVYTFLMTYHAVVFGLGERHLWIYFSIDQGHLQLAIGALRSAIFHGRDDAALLFPLTFFTLKIYINLRGWNLLCRHFSLSFLCLILRLLWYAQ